MLFVQVLNMWLRADCYRETHSVVSTTTFSPFVVRLVGLLVELHKKLFDGFHHQDPDICKAERAHCLFPVPQYTTTTTSRVTWLWFSTWCQFGRIQQLSEQVDHAGHHVTPVQQRWTLLLWVNLRDDELPGGSHIKELHHCLRAQHCRDKQVTTVNQQGVINISRLSLLITNILSKSYFLFKSDRWILRLSLSYVFLKYVEETKTVTQGLNRPSHL